MILDEYGAEDPRRFSSSVGLAGIGLAHRLPEFEFESLAVLLDHLHQECRYAGAPTLRPGSLESNSIQQFPKVHWQVKPRRLVRTPLWFG